MGEADLHPVSTLYSIIFVIRAPQGLCISSRNNRGRQTDIFCSHIIRDAKWAYCVCQMSTDMDQIYKYRIVSITIFNTLHESHMPRHTAVSFWTGTHRYDLSSVHSDVDLIELSIMAREIHDKSSGIFTAICVSTLERIFCIFFDCSKSFHTKLYRWAFPWWTRQSVAAKGCFTRIYACEAHCVELKHRLRKIVILESPISLTGRIKQAN